jgi:hypothetical protein
MGQFLMEKLGLPGSALSGNQHFSAMADYSSAEYFDYVNDGDNDCLF